MGKPVIRRKFSPPPAIFRQSVTQFQVEKPGVVFFIVMEEECKDREAFQPNLPQLADWSAGPVFLCMIIHYFCFLNIERSGYF
jgi:hypothetical protein